MAQQISGQAEALHLDGRHRFSKRPQQRIELVRGKGVLGDAHFGATVKHRSRVKLDPTAPNLRQVHLIPAELQEQLAAQGFPVSPGVMGENITTRGVDLFKLPRATRLQFAQGAVLELTGLRNPCGQLEGVAPGLMRACLERDAEGNSVLRGGVMSIVLTGGQLMAGEQFQVALPPEPHQDMERV